MLSKREMNLLRRSEINLIPYSRLSESDIEILNQLRFNGFVTLVGKRSPNGDLPNPKGFELTNEGRAVVETDRRDKFRFWTPLVISVVLSVAALIISVIALSRT